MALLAEQLVDEWLNRSGYFTIRGIKRGVDEIDLLAIRPSSNEIEARHVEVQVSFRPISYISKLTRDQQISLNLKSANSAAKRPPDVIDAGISEWVKKKFLSPKKMKMRDDVYPGAKWKFSLVHGVVREQHELELIKRSGIELISFKSIIKSLCEAPGWVGGAATDIAEIIGYHSKE
jgi:hypothetical protein